MAEALIAAPELRALLAGGDTARVVVAEIQYEEEIDEYAAGHLPGALDWSWKEAAWEPLAREFRTPAQAAAWLGARGIDRDTTLVLYSGRLQYAVYVAWALGTLAGHPDVRVLDGGRRAWLAAGGELTVEVPEERAAVAYGGGAAGDAARSGEAGAGADPAAAASPRDDASRIGRDELLARLGEPGLRLLDARYAEEYDGLRVKPGSGPDHGAERHGRIPGAVHLPFTALRGDDFRLRSAAELEAAFRAAGAAPDQVREVVVYCRLGHRASLLWFAATRLLGWSHVRVYDGSWTEWGSLVGAPVER